MKTQCLQFSITMSEYILQAAQVQTSLIKVSDLIYVVYTCVL